MKIRRIGNLIRDAIKGTDEDLTKINLNRAIVLLAIPMILEMAGEAVFAVVDAFWVSKVSVEAVATVGLTESVLFLIYAMAIGLSSAATAMVARRVGEGKPEAAADAAAQSILLAVGLSVILGVVGFFYAGDILRLMGGEESLVASGVGYTKIMFGFNVVIMLLFLLNGVFRGVGNATLAMQTLLLSNSINLVLDPCLIFGWGPFPELGVSGAAVATNIGRGTAVAFQLYLLFNGSGIIKLARKHFLIHKEIILRLIRVASGGAGQYLISSASWIILMRIVAEFGSAVVAGYTIAIRLIIFAILPAWGLANAAATLVGQNLGAKKPERASQAAWTTSFYTMLFLFGVSVVCFVLAPSLISFFRDDPEVVKAGIESLRIICAGYVFFAYGMVLSQCLNGAGDTFTPTLINLVCFWFLQVPLAALFALYFEWGASGVYWAVFTTEAVFAVVCILIFRQGKWQKVVI